VKTEADIIPRETSLEPSTSIKQSYRRILLVFVFNLLVSFSAYYLSLTQQDKISQSLTMTANQQLGQLVWQNKNCYTCHSIYGLGGHLGPDLTNEAGRRNRDFIQAYIQQGSIGMPAQKLDEKPLQQLIEYLDFLNKTGEFPTHTFPAHPYGYYSNIKQIF